MTFLIRLLTVLSLVLWAGLSAAQTTSSDVIDQAAWQALADRAEATLDAGRASDEALEDLRAEIQNLAHSFVVVLWGTEANELTL